MKADAVAGEEWVRRARGTVCRWTLSGHVISWHGTEERGGGKGRNNHGKKKKVRAERGTQPHTFSHTRIHTYTVQGSAVGTHIHIQYIHARCMHAHAAERKGEKEDEDGEEDEDVVVVTAAAAVVFVLSSGRIWLVLTAATGAAPVAHSQRVPRAERPRPAERGFRQRIQP